MREDNPATELMNSLSSCISACAVLCSRPAEARRDDILDDLSWFVDAAPLVDVPTVRTDERLTKEMIRAAAEVAARVKSEVLAWDGTAEPPPPLVALARALLASVGMADLADPNKQNPVQVLNNGTIVLHRLSAWAYVEANRRLVVEQVGSFAEAYERLVMLHAEGKLGAEEGDFSQEALDRLKQLVSLIQAGLDTDEARNARHELHDLAERCLRALMPRPGAPPRT